MQRGSRHPRHLPVSSLCDFLFLVSPLHISVDTLGKVRNRDLKQRGRSSWSSINTTSITGPTWLKVCSFPFVLHDASSWQHCIDQSSSDGGYSVETLASRLANILYVPGGFEKVSSSFLLVPTQDMQPRRGKSNPHQKTPKLAGYLLRV